VTVDGGRLRADPQPGARERRVPFTARGWVGSIAAAEALGIGLAAALTPRATEPADALAVAGLVGIVEGSALGLAQGRLLARAVPGLRWASWLGVTAAFAAVAWVLGMLPAALAAGSDSGGDGLLWPVALLVGIPMGLGFGALLGAGQALLLRRRVPHPWRWVSATATGWALGFPVIMVAASAVPAGLSFWVLLLVGAVAGAVAGALLGVVTYLAVGGITVDGPRARRWIDRVVLEMLRGPAHPLLSGRMVELRYRGRQTGVQRVLPVTYAVRHDDAGQMELVVLVGRAARKRWYRSVDDRTPVVVVLHGRPVPAVATLLRRRDAGFLDAWRTYRRRYPRARLGPFDPLLRVETVGTAQGRSRPVDSRSSASRRTSSRLQNAQRTSGRPASTSS
jgi:hypothetical protein